MPIVNIKIWEGRTDDAAKENLIKDVTDAVVKNIKCPAQAVDVCIDEVPMKNWGRGGVVSSKLNL
ncbi:4-oxalocrotonate tautomerase family protein [Candidatus Woesearchaeota archaeon]|nr:4-oxalocrotonate tautomerase family protein [Candidatus Woesearchaeota archaeon]